MDTTRFGKGCKRKRLAVLTAFALALAACDSGTEDPADDVVEITASAGEPGFMGFRDCALLELSPPNLAHD